MEISPPKKTVSFFREHTAKIEIALATLITLSLVATFYYQSQRVGRARGGLKSCYEVRSRLQQIYARSKALDDGLREHGRSTEGPLLSDFQGLKELVSNDVVQQGRVDELEKNIRDNLSMQTPILTEQTEGMISGLLATEDEEFKKQEAIEERFWGRNRILLRGSVLALYFGLLVVVWVLYRKNKRRYELESSLRENDILTRAVMDGGKHGIIVTDKNRIVTVFNKAAERIYGYDADDFLGENAPSFTKKVILKSELEEEAERLGREAGVSLGINEVFAFAIQKYGTYEKEWTLIRKDGTHIPISLTCTTLRDDEGKMHGFLAVLQDISERKELERLKNNFISTISHELRTPLTSIRAALGLLDVNAIGMEAEKVSELISMAQRNSERLVKITNDILDIEKIEFGKLSLNPEPLDLAQFIQEALEANKTYGHKYNVRFIQTGNGCDGVKVVADPDRLMQVMTNLLSNAAKFSNPDSEVRVSAECHNGRVHFCIQDFGSGIPENFRGRVFEKFAQANPSNTREHTGSGLGLNISKQLVEAMDGHIRFETAIGKGTTFFFDMPQAPIEKIT